MSKEELTVSRRGLITAGVTGGVGIAALGAAGPAAAVSWGTDVVAPAGFCQPFSTPVPPIGDNYRSIRNYGTSPHQGTDYIRSWNRQIKSIGAGTVHMSEKQAGFGNLVVVRHANSFYSLYGHMQDGSRAVSVGDTVVAGTVLGLVGYTGSLFPPTQSNAHLHLEVHHPLWTRISPEVFLSKSPAAGEPPMAEEDEMPFYHHRQSTAVTNLSANVSSKVCFSGPADYDLGAGAGGPGLFDITVHLYVEGLTPTDSIELQLGVENATTGATSGWYQTNFPGSSQPVTKIELTGKFRASAGWRIVLTARPSVACTVTAFGKTTINFQD